MLVLRTFNHASAMAMLAQQATHHVSKQRIHFLIAVKRCSLWLAMWSMHLRAAGEQENFTRGHLPALLGLGHSARCCTRRY
mmetsp:Transcript_25406/g.40160  ORF Transcript_25406/g.40160 Transcript_25406/m.40160 type:complete len:81 (-) Transcript_25406:11-253(-)